MEHLTLVGLSEDRSRLLLVSHEGDEFSLQVDKSLRSAVRGEQPHPGHLETRMDSALRPRDIQTRIRAGETPEALAEAGKTTVDKVMTYAAPVLAERAHVAERAQNSSIRRRAGESSTSSGAVRTLKDAVAHHLRAMNVDPGVVEWDAYRREDGRWTLTGRFEADSRSGLATFIFDMPGNYVTLSDDDARWLVGDGRPKAAAATEPSSDPLSEAPAQRRLSAVRSETEASLGEDAIQMVNSPSRSQDTTPDFIKDLAADDTQDLTEALDLESLVEQTFRSDTAPESPAAESKPAAQTAEEPSEPEPPRKSSRKRGRASVPSWDEIMFGGGTSE